MRKSTLLYALLWLLLWWPTLVHSQPNTNTFLRPQVSERRAANRLQSALVTPKLTMKETMAVLEVRHWIFLFRRDTYHKQASRHRVNSAGDHDSQFERAQILSQRGWLEQREITVNGACIFLVRRVVADKAKRDTLKVTASIAGL